MSENSLQSKLDREVSLVFPVVSGMQDGSK